MKRLSASLLLLASFACASSLRAQTPVLPAGASTPADDAPQPASSSASLLTRAENAIAQAHYDEALPLLNKLLALPAAQTTPQTTARAFYDRAYVEEAQHHLDTAEADDRKAIAADPQQFEAHAALGQLLAQQEKWSEARQQLEKAAQLQPASGDRNAALAASDRMLAHVDAELHDDPAASDALLTALKLTPEQPDDTLLAAQLAEEQHDETGAEQEYRKLLAADPASQPAAEGLARSLIHQKKYAAAAPILKAALAQSPNDPVLLAESATVLANQGDLPGAIAQMETLHQQNPNQPAITRMLADLYSTGGQPQQAEPLYQQLLASDPHNPELLTAAAENLMAEQKWPEAIALFQQSTTLQPDQPDAWSGLAFAASENHQYTLALTALDHRAKSLPESPATLYLRASALDHLHYTKTAVSFYRQFLHAAQGQFPAEEADARARLQQLQIAPPSSK